MMVLIPNETYCQQRILSIDNVYQVHPCCWCWASCIAIIGRYYGNDNLQLCDVVDMRRVNMNLGNNNCCSLQTPYNNNDSTTCISSCSFWGLTDPIATIFQTNLGIGVSYVTGALTYAQIKSEIDNNRPIKIIAGRPRTPPATGTAYHSMVIIGYNDNGQIIHYIDPIGGNYAESYSNITSTFCMGLYDYEYGYAGSTNYTFTNNACPTNLNLTYNIGSNATIRASNNIQCNSVIQNSANVSFIAGSQIQLNSGFEVTVGSTFNASVSNSPCQ